MDFECTFQSELKELDPVPALTIRTRTSVAALQGVFNEGYAAIARFLASKGFEPSGRPFAVYFNMDFEDLDVEFGFPVGEAVEGEGNMTSGATPSGRAVTTLYIGPYEDVEPAYTALMKWAEDNGLELEGTAYEIYMSDPAVTPPEQLKTRIHLLLAE
ncbi:GyrI-like domain-containing protein [Prosthecochloris sp. GSB1]|uniref:GyrI-like domain-containing protein n=1 Tax=Prosthecochloris sp. GSB1 TaxID=281093 RepID=UPI0012373492|nr:GyrI-like domain-containing protein [Prosthecochloris sp. GSB1]